MGIESGKEGIGKRMWGCRVGRPSPTPLCLLPILVQGSSVGVFEVAVELFGGGIGGFGLIEQDLAERCDIRGVAPFLRFPEFRADERLAAVKIELFDFDRRCHRWGFAAPGHRFQ